MRIVSKSLLNSRSISLLVLSLIPLAFLWAFLTTPSIELPSEESRILFYARHCRHDLKSILCKAIKKTQHSIFLSIYALTDLQVLQLLNQKATEEHLPIKIHYDPSASRNLKNVLDPSISLLPHRQKGLMHRKILVLDESKVFLSSANLTKSSLKLHDNLLIGLFDPALATFLIQNCHRQDQSFYPFTLQNQRAALWLLPDRKDEALEALIHIIAQAKKDIKIAMFTLTHPRLCSALIEARKRGVEVELVIDYYTGRGASSKAIESLRAEGIAVFTSRGEELLHHKWAWIDRHTLIHGSANWTTSAFQDNQDYILIFNPLSPHQKKFMKRLWRGIAQNRRGI
ncbi:MAG: phospholipase D-like domain-containing protein [Anaerolineae bacterium]